MRYAIIPQTLCYKNTYATNMADLNKIDNHSTSDRPESVERKKKEKEQK